LEKGQKAFYICTRFERETGYKREEEKQSKKVPKKV
jgi:hypothetical protein